MRLSPREKALKLIVTIIVAVFFLFPIYWDITSSIKTNVQLFAYPAALIPTQISFSAWTDIFAGRTGLSLLHFRNSVAYGLSIVAITIIIALPAAYAASRFEFRGKRGLSAIMYFVMVVPSTVLVIPLFLILVTLHLYDTAYGYILVFSALAAPFAVWLLKPFIDAIPKEIEESAMVDGASRFRILRSIIAPLSLHGIVVISLLTFVSAFNDFAISWVMLNDNNIKTYPASLVARLSEIAMAKGGNPLYGQLIALTVLGMLPPLVLFLIFQRYFQEALLQGAARG